MIKHTIKMLHSCFGTGWLLIGQGGVSFGLPRVLVGVNVNGRLAKSAVNLNKQGKCIEFSKHISLANSKT